jgi:hypothetical protein
MAIHFALALDVSLDELQLPKGKKVSGKRPSRKVLRRLEEIEKLPRTSRTTCSRPLMDS